jgi:hypothetical protein
MMMMMQHLADSRLNSQWWMDKNAEENTKKKILNDEEK